MWYQNKPELSDRSESLSNNTSKDSSKFVKQKQLSQIKKDSLKASKYNDAPELITELKINSPRVSKSISELDNKQS